MMGYPGRELELLNAAKNYNAWIVDEFLPYLRGQVLEVGAGTGNFSQRFVSHAAISILTAIEPDPGLFVQLESRLAGNEKARCLQGTLRDVLRTAAISSDAACYINVLEHIADDEDELKLIYDTLVPGGYICLFVPALQWLFGSVDAKVGHFRRYHKKPLMELVEKSGFKIIHCRYFDSFGMLPWWLLYRCLRIELKTGQISFYDKWTVPLMRRVEALLPPLLGKNLLLIAQKP